MNSDQFLIYLLTEPSVGLDLTSYEKTRMYPSVWLMEGRSKQDGVGCVINFDKYINIEEQTVNLDWRNGKSIQSSGEDPYRNGYRIELLWSKAFGIDESSPKELLELAYFRLKSYSFLPVKSLQKNYESIAKHRQITKALPTSLFGKFYRAGGDESIYREFTDPSTRMLERVNLSLTLDVIDDANASLINRLNLFTHWQGTKYQGHSYAIGLCSSFDIFRMAYAKQFFLPNFILASTDATYDWGSRLFAQKEYTGINPDVCFHNMIFEINSEDYCEDSALLNNNQSNIENLNLFSAYNLYEWSGVKSNAEGVMVVSLKVLSPKRATDPATGEILSRNQLSINRSWVASRVSSLQLSRENISASLIYNFKELCASYGRSQRYGIEEFPPITWLNSTL